MHGSDYYVCGLHLYRRGADCDKAWYIPKSEVEDLVFEALLAKLTNDGDKLAAWVAAINASMEEEWKKFSDSFSRRRQTLSKLEEQPANLIDVAAQETGAPELARKIEETSAAIARLRKLNDISKPKPVTTDEILEARRRILEAFHSADPELRKQVLTGHVIELAADPRNRTIEGIALNPRHQTKKKKPPSKGDFCIQTFGSPEGFRKNVYSGDRTRQEEGAIHRAADI